MGEVTSKPLRVCEGEHKPTFKFIGRDMSWYLYDGSWWYMFKCKICGRVKKMAGWYFWGNYFWDKELVDE